MSDPEDDVFPEIGWELHRCMYRPAQAVAYEQFNPSVHRGASVFSLGEDGGSAHSARIINGIRMRNHPAVGGRVKGRNVSRRARHQSMEDHYE